MTCDGLRSHPECLQYCSFYSECYRCRVSGWSLGSFDCPRACGDGGVGLPAIDGGVDAPATPKDATDSHAVDAGATDGYPSATQTRVLDCNPFVDAD